MKFFKKFYLTLIAVSIIVTQNAFVKAEAAENREIHEVALGETFTATYGASERVIYSYTAEESGVYYLTPDDVHEGYESILIQWFDDSNNFIDWQNVYYDYYFDEYLCNGSTLLLEEGETYYFELITFYSEVSSYEMSLTLRKRPFNIDSVTVENQVRYIGDENYCGVYVTYWETPADEEVEPTITVVLDGNSFSGLVYEVYEQIYDAYGYRANMSYGFDEVVVDEYMINFTQEVSAPIESVTIEDFSVIYSESFIDFCEDWYFVYNEETDEDEIVMLYKLLYEIYGDPVLTVVAEGKTYSGTLTEVREQLHEVYGVWFSLNILPAAERFTAGNNSIEYYFGGIKTTMNLVLRDDITEIEAPVVKRVSRIYKDPVAVGPEVTLTWNPVDIGTRATITYYVYRAEETVGKASKSAGYVLIGQTYDTKFTDKNIEAGKYYYYVVKTVCSETDLSSANSNVVSFRPIFKTEKPIKNAKTQPVSKISGLTLAK